MCRYGFTTYKPHYACFSCQKTFKRRLLTDIQEDASPAALSVPAKCPQCGELMANMGLDFKAPKKQDTKAWQHLAQLYEVGIAFHSCGCGGPGYVPRDQQELLQHFEQIKQEYLKQQHFWARRKSDPTSPSTIAKDQHKHQSFLYALPYHLRGGTKNKPQYDAVQAQAYWAGKVKEVEQKMELILRNKN